MLLYLEQLDSLELHRYLASVRKPCVLPLAPVHQFIRMTLHTVTDETELEFSVN